jgi:hypothetical protein
MKIIRKLDYYRCYVKMIGHTFVFKVDGNQCLIFDPYVNYLPHARRKAYLNYHKKVSLASMKAREI